MAVTGRKPDLMNQLAPSDPRQQNDPADAAGTIVALEPPADISEAAREMWDLITPDLVEHKLLKPSDLPLLIEMVEALALAKRFRERLLTEMDGMNDPAEVKRLRTAWVDALRSASSLAGDFGIGPVARVRLGLTKLQGASLQDLIAARRGASARSS